QVLGVDINARALQLTRVNAALAGVPVDAAGSDLLSGVPGAFDLIVSNPPYLVDPAARAYRHGGGDLGAGLSLAILEASLDRLAPGGTLVLYTGAAIVNGIDPFKVAALARCGGAEWTYAEVDPDVFGEELEAGAYSAADRIAAVVLTVTKQE
ncbi:MAG: methyltransferase, partial [Gemmatimonadaceae bacterium]|nr:methyltransferase [Acetobacteraceae bacterium]